jgi:hypothetical protein
VRARNDPDSFTCGHVLCDYVIANPDFAVASALPVSGVPEAARHLNNELILHPAWCRADITESITATETIPEPVACAETCTVSI